MPKIVIADDNQPFREALINIIKEYEIAGEAQDGVAAIKLVKKTKPDLLLLDLSLPRMNGLHVLKKIRPSYPHLKIIILTMHEAKDYYQECINEGVDAYVLKDEGSIKLKEVIRRVLAGEKYFSPGLQ
jgi:DNA-binding NarL/FixJ family response regulator